MSRDQAYAAVLADLRCQREEIEAVIRVLEIMLEREVEKEKARPDVPSERA